MWLLRCVVFGVSGWVGWSTGSYEYSLFVLVGYCRVVVFPHAIVAAVFRFIVIV